MAEKRAHETNSEPDTEESESELEIVKESEKGASSKKINSVKTVQKKKYKTRFSKEWESKFPFVKPCNLQTSDKEYKFFCSVCNVNLSCAQGGISDVSIHSSKFIFNIVCILHMSHICVPHTSFIL